MAEVVLVDVPKGIPLSEVKRLLAAEELWECDLSGKVHSAGAADLMSDVLLFSRAGMLLLTGLASVQAVRTAAVADLRAVVFVRNKRPKEDVIDLAREKGIPLLTTSLTMFEASGVLYRALLER
jgi:hypothetical protein